MSGLMVGADVACADLAASSVAPYVHEDVREPAPPVQEIWPADTTPVEGNKDALDSAFLTGDEPDMQNVMVRMHASCLPPATAVLELI